MLQSLGSDIKNKSGNESLTRQGSLRKVLPSGSNKVNLFGNQNEDLNNFYTKFHQEYVVLAEYKMICSENIGGVYVIPSNKSALVWFGVIFVRSGFYEGGIFRFTINLDENFPNCQHPIVSFDLQINHPVISSDKNELNLMGAFPTWTKGEQHIWQVLKYIKWAFHNVQSSVVHAVNEDSVKLLQENENDFAAKCKDCVKRSKEVLYKVPEEEDRHYIVFEEYTPHIHDTARQSMLHFNNNFPERGYSLGHSWVKEGTFRPLSKESSLRSDSAES